MKQYNIYRSFVFTITTSFVFFIWGILQPMLISLSGIKILFSAIIGAVISLGAYRMVLNIIESLTVKFSFIKKIVFGRTYLDGIWVGAYIGSNGQPRYFIEYFEQDFNSLIIRGRCYYADKTYKGNWVSKNVSIDEDKGELYYVYDTTMEDKGFSMVGFAVFNFERKNKSAYSTKLYGFSSDIDSGTMHQAVEEKVLNKGTLTETELLDLAIKVFQNNKDTILKHVE